MTLERQELGGSPLHSLGGIFIHASNMLSVSLSFKHVLRAGGATVSKTTGVLGLREVGSLAGVTQLLKQWNCDASLQDVSFSPTI